LGNSIEGEKRVSRTHLHTHTVEVTVKGGAECRRKPREEELNRKLVKEEEGVSEADRQRRRKEEESCSRPPKLPSTATVSSN
jgi:hypothetical protein